MKRSMLGRIATPLAILIACSPQTKDSRKNHTLDDIVTESQTTQTNPKRTIELFEEASVFMRKGDWYSALDAYERTLLANAQSQTEKLSPAHIGQIILDQTLCYLQIGQIDYAINKYETLAGDSLNGIPNQVKPITGNGPYKIENHKLAYLQASIYKAIGDNYSAQQMTEEQISWYKKSFETLKPFFVDPHLTTPMNLGLADTIIASSILPDTLRSEYKQIVDNAKQKFYELN